MKGHWYHVLGPCSEAVERFLPLWHPDSLGSEHLSDLPQASNPGCQSQSLSPPLNSDTTEITPFPYCLSGGKQGSRPALRAEQGCIPACWPWACIAEEAERSMRLLVPQTPKSCHGRSESSRRGSGQSRVLMLSDQMHAHKQACACLGAVHLGPGCV